MANRAHHGRHTKWQTVVEPKLWRHAWTAGTVGAVSMEIRASAVALARDTTRHDRYAAARITAADLPIAAGFGGDLADGLGTEARRGEEFASGGNRAYVEETNRTNREHRASGAGDRKELAEVEKKITSMIAVIKDGGYVRGLGGPVMRVGSALGRTDRTA